MIHVKSFLNEKYLKLHQRNKYIGEKFENFCFNFIVTFFNKYFYTTSIENFTTYLRHRAYYALHSGFHSSFPHFFQNLIEWNILRWVCKKIAIKPWKCDEKILGWKVLIKNAR